MREGGCSRALTAGLAALVLFLSGCVPQARYTETIVEYDRASHQLGRAADALFLHANTVEAESYIDTQTFERQLLSRPAIDAHAILSDEGLRFRRNAIAALSEYALALAAVASGQTEDKIAADAVAAGTGLASLTGDLQAAIAKDQPNAKTTEFSGVVSAAASAAGDLIQLIEKRRNRAELRASLRKNDPAMKALFEMIGADAERLYKRQQMAVQNRGDTMFGSYATAIGQTPTDGAYVLELSDRIKRYRREMDLLALSNPAPAFAAWKSAHDDLVTVLLENGGPAAQRASFKQIVAEVDAFAGEVQPLAANLEMLAQSI